MKKKSIINLIKYHMEGNDVAFEDEAFEIARDFNESGDIELAEYIRVLLSGKNAFVPQKINGSSDFFRKIEYVNAKLPLPMSISEDIKGISNAIFQHSGVNKFLFSGSPGTGKTECAKQLCRILNRELYALDFNSVIDSKLGETAKNIGKAFNEINNLDYPDQVIILFDEMDALAMDRVNSRDLREMGRATTAVLKGLDGLNDNIVFIATTNLITSFDKALLRRFDKVIDFNRYSQEDLLEVAVVIYDEIRSRFKNIKDSTRLFKKIISLMNPIPYPGDLKNLIRTSIAFSNFNDGNDYLRRMVEEISPGMLKDYKLLIERGFTLREIEAITGVSKSQISRETARETNE